MISQRIQNPFIRFSAASLFFMLVVIVTLSFAAWQVNRGMSAQNKPRIPNLHKPQALRGIWSQSFWLLDNRTEKGKPGYWVMTLFETNAGAVYPVLLGFLVSQDRHHIVLPEFKLPAIPRVHERIWPKSFVWGNPSVQKISENLWRLQSIEIKDFESQYPHIESTLLQLNTPPEGLVPVLGSENYLKPYTHFGYAMQWALLSLAAAFFMFRLRKEKTYVVS